MAKFVYGGVEALVEIDVGGVGPELALEGFAADDFAGLPEQGGEDLEGLSGESNPVAVLAEFTSSGVEFVGSECKTRGGLGKRTHSWDVTRNE